jgi:hypothetical protein
VAHPQHSGMSHLKDMKRGASGEVCGTHRSEASQNPSDREGEVQDMLLGLPTIAEKWPPCAHTSPDTSTYTSWGQLLGDMMNLLHSLCMTT